MKKYVTILGWAGNHNLGDEAIVASIVERLKKEGCLNIHVFSKDPKHTSSIHRCSSSYIKNVFTNLRYLLKTKVLIFGGGGIIHDYQSIFHLLFWYYHIFFTKLFGGKVVVFSQTIGPLKKNQTKLATTFILPFIDSITVRDFYSYEVMKNAFPKKKVILSEDVVFSKEFLLQNEKNKKKQIVFSLKNAYLENWNSSSLQRSQGEYIQELVKLIDTLSEKLGREIILLPFETSPPHDDITFNKQIYEKLERKKNVRLVEDELSLTKVLNILSESELLIGVRLHSLILSSIVGTPFLTLSYSNKTTQFTKKFSSLSKDFLFDISTFNSEEVVSATEKLLKNSAQVELEIVETTSKLKEKVEKNFEEVLLLLRK